MKFRDRALLKLFGFMILAVMTFGCAHVAAVAKACKPAPADVDTALADLQSDGWQAALDQFAIDKTACIARAAVQEVVAALGGSQPLEMVGTPSSADIVRRGRAWLTAPPQ